MGNHKNWSEIYQQLQSTDQENALPPESLETLALAAYLIGREPESYQYMERAHQTYLGQGKTEAALRSAFWLGLMLRNAGKKAMGNGWMALGERILKEKPISEKAVQGLFLIPRALEAFGTGSPAKAQALFEQAAAIGVETADADLTILGRLGLGQAFILQGEISRGLKLLDEMMVTVQSQEVFPVVNGIVYCAVIETCRKVWDIKRAQEWTAELTRWCEEQPGIVPFKGQCLIHRAEIFQWYGDWPIALDEINNACEWMAQVVELPAAGEAFYRKAELHRLKGEFEEADVCYNEAGKRGRMPQPGLALLRLATRRNEEAATGIRNALTEARDKRKRADLLPSVVLIMLAVKQIDEAKVASKELRAIADEFDVPYLHAMAGYCQGNILLEENKLQEGLKHLQNALHHWNSLHFPYESACTRELRGRIYMAMNDADNSKMEFEAARWIFEQLHAMPDLQRMEQYLNKKPDKKKHGLTLREVQVLNLVALGKTNRMIAEQLFISERTVDRHVSNIFNKLGVLSRVSAITWALQNKIVDSL